jgi:hypothetical protein
MKDHNHDLVQALHHVLDNEWRAKQYRQNAAGCDRCVGIWDKFEQMNKELADMLRGEIAQHVKEERFD